MPTDMQTVTTTTDYHVAVGDQLVFTNQPAFVLSQPIVSGAWASPSPHLWISGEVDVVMTSVAAAGTGINGIDISNTFDSGPSVTLDAGATLKVSATGGRGTGYFGGGEAAPTIDNAGTVLVNADDVAVGLFNGVTGGVITNRGQVTVTSTTSDATGLKTNGYGVQVVNSGTVIATGHGQVTGVDMGGSGTAEMFRNTGTITAHDDSAINISVGVYWANGPQPGLEGSFINDGAIEADRALEVSTITGTAAENLITNNGHMIGDVLLNGVAPATFVNNGDVRGAIDLRSNGSVYDGRLGTVEGSITVHNMGGDTLLGGAGAETITGAGNEIISGGGGNDLIDGGQDAITGGVGFDQINGNEGDDTIVGHSVVGDWLSGGQGNDLVNVSASSGQNIVNGNLGDDSIVGGSGFNAINGNQGEDTLIGHSAVGDWLSGGQGNDLIDASGSAGHNLIFGNLGADTLVGGAGGDTLRGGQGDDSITAGSGSDWIAGDLGNNTIAGGSGDDTFHGSAGRDLILNWHDGDRVHLDLGVTYQVTQSGSDVHIDLSNGGQLILQHVDQARLQAGWIFNA